MQSILYHGLKRGQTIWHPTNCSLRSFRVFTPSTWTLHFAPTHTYSLYRKNVNL